MSNLTYGKFIRRESPMRLTELSIDGFGVLAHLRLDDLQPGLNVVHGPNGSGKTTLLHFLRGVWCGFDDARQRRFLPPLSGGHPGGTIEVAQGERRYQITRQALPNATDRLAVTIKRGTIDDTGTVRATVDALEPELMHLLFAVGGSEAHALNRLLELAARDGISLDTQRRRSARFDARLAEVRERRITLLGGEGASGETERLREACRTASVELAVLQAEADRLRDHLASRYEQVIGELERLASRVHWLDLERQALQSQLIETEGATVPGPVPAIVENRIVVECRPHDDLQHRVREIDQRIAHARAVLEDLARSRMRVSVQTAQYAGMEAVDVPNLLQEQRATLRSLENETLQLRTAAEQLTRQAAGACQCSPLDALVQQSVRSLQQHIYLLCQQLGRQEQAQRQGVLLTERSHLDRCEAELLEHVARLQRERTALLGQAQAPELSALRHQSVLEAQACGCSEHHQFADRTTPKVRLQVSPAPQEAPRLPDSRRVEWQRTLGVLTEELDRTKAAWREALALRSEWDLERARLIALERRMAEQDIEVQSRANALTERLEEGQSLLLVEAGLEKMRGNVFEDEAAPVIADASRLLAELTGERYRSIQVTKTPWDVSAVNDSGLAISSQALSRGTLDQVGLCLRIALSDEYARRGVALPLVLDDVLSDSDPDRVDAAVRLLQRVADRQQILFLTCQEHLAARFEAAGVTVRDFPGTRRTRTRVTTLNVAAAESPAAPIVLNTPTPLAAITAIEPESVPAEAESVHPSEPHWLRVNSPAAMIPSLGEQMARRLSAAGVQTIGDLIELDPEEADLPLDSLQISPSEWRIWQAEGRLLTCVPQLSGRDAQMLAAVGILLPQELASADADTLVRKIDRLRGDGRSGWVLPGFVWPDRNVVLNWIGNARRSRTFREACAADGWESRRSRTERAGRRHGGRSGRHFRVDQPSGQRGPRGRRRLGQRRRPIATLGPLPSASESPSQPVRSFGSTAGEGTSTVARGERETMQAFSAGAPARLRFHLELQSPIIDAPSIGPTTARRFEKVGVLTVADLLNRDAQQLTDRLQHSRINSDTVRQWQDQSRLLCQIPELRGHDAQVLVACGLRDPESVARLSPQALFAIVGPFVATKEGQRLLRSAKSPDLAEVTDWIQWAQQSRTLKAA